MYRSENYARIQCSECNKIIDEIMPGQVFKELKICECQKKEVKRVIRKSTTKARESQSK